MKPLYAIIGLIALMVVGGCATVPSGPSQMALPGTGRTFEQFRMDDDGCQRYASQRIGGRTPEENAQESAIRSAVVSTAVGAAAGAAIAGRSSGTGIGAGMGLLFGAMAGSGASERSAYNTQRQYDNAYVQCMYARGHRVPVSAEMARILQRQPAPARIPDPPRGNPPPPPAGY